MNNLLFIALVIMAVISVTNFFSLTVAGISILVGIAGFVLYRQRNKASEHELNLKQAVSQLKMPHLWLWLLLPLLMNVVSLSLAAAFLPDFIDHLYERTEVAVSFQVIILLVIQLAILALGEEIAWRAFFQKQVSQLMPIIPAILVTSIVFSVGHFTAGSPLIVGYDILFIFINSVLYGVVFYKTNNAWMSAFSHFLANVFAIFSVLFLF